MEFHKEVCKTQTISCQRQMSGMCRCDCHPQGLHTGCKVSSAKRAGPHTTYAEDVILIRLWSRGKDRSWRHCMGKDDSVLPRKTDKNGDSFRKTHDLAISLYVLSSCDNCQATVYWHMYQRHLKRHAKSNKCSRIMTRKPTCDKMKCEDCYVSNVAKSKKKKSMRPDPRKKNKYVKGGCYILNFDGLVLKNSQAEQQISQKASPDVHIQLSPDIQHPHQLEMGAANHSHDWSSKQPSPDNFQGHHRSKHIKHMGSMGSHIKFENPYHRSSVL